MNRLVLQLLLAVYSLLPTGNAEGPVLNVTEEYIDVPLGSIIYLKCNGTYPLAWKFRYSVNKRESSLQALASSKTALFESIIRVEFDNYATTGRYICYYRNESQPESASIYIFVNSVEDILLPVEGYPFDILFIEDGEVLTVPCLPTNSSAEVSLRKSTVSTVDLNSGVDFCDETMELEEKIPYDPTKGFEIYNTTSYYRGPFCCEATLGERKEEIVFIFGTKSFTLVAFTRAREMGYFIVNSMFSFNCFLLKNGTTTKENFYYGWSYPAAAADRIRIGDIKQVDYQFAVFDLLHLKLHPESLKSLTVQSAKKTDSGFYKCTVMSPSYEVCINEIFVTIHDAQGFPYLITEGDSVEFKMDYRTFPKSLKHYWKWNFEGISQKPEKYEFFEEDGASILKVHNVSKNETGIYSFSIYSNGFYSKTFYRCSLLPGVPRKLISVTVNNNNRIKDSRICRGPTAEWVHMEWLWRPVCDNACVTSVRLEVSLKEDVSVVKTMGFILGSLGTALSVTNNPGEYFCRATNEFGSTEINVLITNHSVVFQPQNFPPVLRVNQDEARKLSCTANKSLYNRLEIWWRPSGFNSFQLVNNSVESFETENELKANFPFGMAAHEEGGTYKCSASYKNDSSRTYEKSCFIFVTSSRHRFIYFTNMDADEVVRYVNDSLELFCYTNSEFYIMRRHWRFNGEALLPDNNTVVLEYAQKLIIKHLSMEHAGFYDFEIVNGQTELNEELYSDSRRVKLLVKTHLVISETNMNFSTVRVKPREFVDLLCYAEDLWETNITWSLNNSTLDDNSPGVKFDDQFQKLRIEGLTEKNSGVYECRVENKLGFVSAQITLLVNIPPGKLDIFGIIGFSILGAILLVFSSLFIAFMLLGRRRRRKNAEDLAKLQWVNDETSSEDDDFDYEVSPEDAMLCNQELPDDSEPGPAFDEKLEFPKNRLKFGKSLGSGEFGSVVKAKAIGIQNFEPSTVVAVKMAKERGNPVHEAALKKELKILILLGYHLNIMNILGAVTRNPKGFMIIVEYCRHGNLRCFLQKHRNRFVPHATERSKNSEEEEKQMKIFVESPTLGNDEEDLFPMLHSPLGSENIDQQSFTEKSQSAICNSRPFGTCAGQSFGATAATKFPKKRKGSERRLFTSDLICYAFQCARGMSYLASKKLVHRDLAARNILLAEGNVIKICDYGLTKDIYNYPNYIPNKDVPLPFKWMAIESLAHRVFSTKTDVWSFGVVLWEIFALGKNPYPGIPADEHFYFKLKEGYRMEKPEFATEDIYQLMRTCWKESPGERPNFCKLTELLGDVLEVAVRERYINLNEPYAKRNDQSSLSDPEVIEKNASLENFTCLTAPTSAEAYCEAPGTFQHSSGHVGTSYEVPPHDKILCNSLESCFPQTDYVQESAESVC